MDKKHLVIVLLAVASAFGLASCKSSAGPLSGKGGEPMPAADYLALLDGIDSAICVSLDYNRHRYARHPMTYHEAAVDACRRADAARRELGTYKPVRAGGYTVFVRSSDEYDFEAVKKRQAAASKVRRESFGVKSKAYMDARGTAFFLSWRWGCAVGDRSARDSLDAVAMRGTDSWTRSRSGSDDLAALRSGRIVVDTAYVSRGGGKARPVELRSCRFRVLSNPPASYELSGSFLYKGKNYTFTMRENQRHNVCDVSGE